MLICPLLIPSSLAIDTCSFAPFILKYGVSTLPVFHCWRQAKETDKVLGSGGVYILEKERHIINM